jgi:predicted LPLAT superfamily acyltransferase
MRQPTRHWATIGERTFASGILWLLHVYRLLGAWPFKLFMYPVVGFYFITSASARRASLTYLQRMQISGSVVKPNLRTSFRHFVHFSDGLLDKLLANTPDFKAPVAAIYNRELATQLLDKKQGFLILTSHLGTVEVARTIAKLSNRPLNVLTHTKNSQSFMTILKKLNPNTTFNLIETSQFDPALSIKLSEKVANGEIIAVAGDRVPVSDDGKHAVPCEFLGQTAYFPTGGYLLAFMFNCPILLMFCCKNALGYTVEYEVLADKIELPRQNRAAALQGYAQQYAHRLAQACHKYPLEWFNFFDFWRAYK